MGRIVVLLGAPGSGKSTVGAELGRRGLRWRDWETALLERWGSLEAFAANKDAALAEHHSGVLHLADAGPAPLVYESTGLSEADFLDRLQAERPGTLVVRLDISEEEMLRRVQARPPGQHLSDEADRNLGVLRAFERHVLPNRRVDLVFDAATRSPAEIAGEILSLLRSQN